MNVEKKNVSSVTKKAKHVCTTVAANVDPAPLPPSTYPALPQAVQLQFKNQTGFGNFVKQSVEHYTTKEKKRA